MRHRQVHCHRRNAEQNANVSHRGFVPSLASLVATHLKYRGECKVVFDRTRTLNSAVLEMVAP
jgi:hypothetical protein